MHKLLVAAALLLVPFSANALTEADCQANPKCTELGYTVADATADCEKVFCPFDSSYAKCVSDTCTQMGYTNYSKSHWCFKIKKCPHDESYTLCAEGNVIDPNFLVCNAPLASNNNCALGDILFFSGLGKFHCTSLDDYDKNMLECIGEPKGVIAADMGGKRYAIKTKASVNVYKPTDRISTTNSYVTWSNDQIDSDSNTGRTGCPAAFNIDADWENRDNYSYITAVLIGKAAASDSKYVSEGCLLSNTKNNPGNFPERLRTIIEPHEFFATPIVSGGRYWGFPNVKILKNIANNIKTAKINTALTKIGMDNIPTLINHPTYSSHPSTVWSLDYNNEQFAMNSTSLAAYCSPNCGNWDGHSIELNAGFFSRDASGNNIEFKPFDHSAMLESLRFGILVMDLENFGTPYKK